MVANQEPKYAKKVFKRLRETLDVVLTDNAIIAWRDDSIKPNYRIRKDGLRLRDCPVDLLNWTPVCDLEEYPDSPDPLTTPALPFPFTARQLAAFMLDGWGMLLAERFAGNDGKIDAEIVKALLGGVRDANPRRHGDGTRLRRQMPLRPHGNSQRFRGRSHRTPRSSTTRN